MKRKILLITPQLEGGGAEKVFRIIIENLNPEYFDIHILVISHPTGYYNSIPKHIEKESLNYKRVRYSLYGVYKHILKVQPSVVLCFNITHLAIWMGFLKAFLPKDIKVVCRESTILSAQNKGYVWYKQKILNFLYRKLYKNVDSVIALSKSMSEDLVINYQIPKNKIEVIGNPISSKKVMGRSLFYEGNLPENKFNLVFVGRLSKEKRLEFLLKAVAMAQNQYIHLTLIGKPSNDEYHEKLKRIVEKYELEEKVTFFGHQSNPYPYLAKANMLVMTSRYEGFPNVILESFALGIPVMVLESIANFKEFVDNETGIVAPNKESFIKELKTIHLKEWDKQKIQEKAEQKYNLLKIMKNYERILS